MPELSQNCAETMLIKAAQLVLKKNIVFEYPSETADVQVDLGPAFMTSPETDTQTWYSGKKETAFKKDLDKLDKEKVYFLRTGTNGGAGHWQTLFFDSAAEGWVNYSSETNKEHITHKKKLLTAGQSLLAPHAAWGQAQGQYAFLLIEASPANVIKASNFLYDFRVQGEDCATLNAATESVSLYTKLQATDLLEASSSPDSTDVEKLNRRFNCYLKALKTTTDVLVKRNTKVSPVARQLIEKLTSAHTKFQNETKNGPTREAIVEFQRACEAAITKVVGEFQQHRGWHAIDPILRGILGLFALLTIVPALVVQATTKHGYAGTFFDTPKTDAANALDTFQGKLNLRIFPSPQ